MSIVIHNHKPYEIAPVGWTLEQIQELQQGTCPWCGSLLREIGYHCPSCGSKARLASILDWRTERFCGDVRMRATVASGIQCPMSASHFAAAEAKKKDPQHDFTPIRVSELEGYNPRGRKPYVFRVEFSAFPAESPHVIAPKTPLYFTPEGTITTVPTGPCVGVAAFPHPFSV